MKEKNKFEIKECEGILNPKELEIVVSKLPIDFYMVKSDVDPHLSTWAKHTRGIVEVYHDALIINLHPAEGERLYNAEITRNIPLNPHNMMDENLGLRCCFHPKIGLFLPEHREAKQEFEIDIYRHPRNDKYGKNGRH